MSAEAFALVWYDLGAAFAEVMKLVPHIKLAIHNPIPIRRVTLTFFVAPFLSSALTLYSICLGRAD